jgi:molybdenum cofactor cytidylyltransferase
MRVQQVPISESEGLILFHNIADGEGRKMVAKGTRLTAKEIGVLRDGGYETVWVAVPEDGDVHEDVAATRIAAALAKGIAEMRMTRAVGGRINFHGDAPVMLEVNTERLTAFNSLPGVTLATRPQHTPLGKSIGRTDIATLKIIPYAISKTILAEAIALAEGILRLIPLLPQKVALLITTSAGSAARLMAQFEAPTRTRLERLGSVVSEVRTVVQEEEAIATMVRDLLATHNALFIGGQTSIMDITDPTLRGLTLAGVDMTLHGVPVEPGNMLALGYAGKQWVLCAPGCAKSLETNVVDLVLPRLLAGERLDRSATATLGLGGLL